MSVRLSVRHTRWDYAIEFTRWQHNTVGCGRVRFDVLASLVFVKFRFYNRSEVDQQYSQVVCIQWLIQDFRRWCRGP